MFQNDGIGEWEQQLDMNKTSYCVTPGMKEVCVVWFSFVGGFFGEGGLFLFCLGLFGFLKNFSLSKKHQS